MNMQQLMEVVIVYDTRLYKGVEITITWADDVVGDFGGFWGWKVGNKEMRPMWRHKGICLDDAKSYIDKLQAESNG
ncbi:MAG: hypothetical protein IT328_07905 [Caldilineaceae bacterium]|nr:hypothetical protein [Caldilineaceae bacterium]